MEAGKFTLERKGGGGTRRRSWKLPPCYQTLKSLRKSII